MVFSRKLAGALAVASALAVAAGAGASPGDPGNGVSGQVAHAPGVVGGAKYAACVFWRRQAQAAIDAYRLSLELPDGTGNGGAAAYEAFQAAVAEYEDLGCRALMGPPPEWPH